MMSVKDGGGSVRVRSSLALFPSNRRRSLAAGRASRMIRATMISNPPMSRRSVLAAAVATMVAHQALAADRPVVRVGTLPFGAVHWEIAAIQDGALDKTAGVSIENVPLASEAARIGFLSGSVDTIMTDLLFAARLRSEGTTIKFLPYSTAEGSLVVKSASPIRRPSPILEASRSGSPGARSTRIGCFCGRPPRSRDSI